MRRRVLLVVVGVAVVAGLLVTVRLVVPGGHRADGPSADAVPCRAGDVDRLDLSDQYPQFAKLKQWVIDPAVEEINGKSDLKVDWRPIRKKRVVHTLEFKYTKEQPPAQIPEKLVKRRKQALTAAPPPEVPPEPVSEEAVAKELALMRATLGIAKKSTD